MKLRCPFIVIIMTITYGIGFIGWHFKGRAATRKQFHKMEYVVNHYKAELTELGIDPNCIMQEEDNTNTM